MKVQGADDRDHVVSTREILAGWKKISMQTSPLVDSEDAPDELLWGKGD